MIVYKHEGSQKQGVNEYFCDLCKQQKEPNELHSFRVVNGKLVKATPEERDSCQHHLCIDCRWVVSDIFPV